MSGDTSMLGLVVTGHGRHYVVEDMHGERRLCHPRGKKSEAVVGDRVHWRVTDDAGREGVIESIEPRRNLLFRQDDWKTKSFAANLDQLLVLVAVEPVFSESQLARALIAAASVKLPVTIVLNKADLPGLATARMRLQPYEDMGMDLKTLAIKAQPDTTRLALTEQLTGKSTLVLGPSGAGKSSLINLMVPDARAQIGDISRALQSGRHTTTTTQWYWIDRERQTSLIDSPGFQEFGLRQVSSQDLAGLMPDIDARAQACRFYNCTHVHEPGCGVLAAVEHGEISASRHRIYTEIRDELSRTRW